MIKYTGYAAIPVNLLQLGMNLDIKKETLFRKEVFLATGIKLLIVPLIAVIITKMINFEPYFSKSLILQSAMPTAVYSVILCRRYSDNCSFTANTIFMTTVLSSISLLAVIKLIT